MFLEHSLGARLVAGSEVGGESGRIDTDFDMGKSWAVVEGH